MSPRTRVEIGTARVVGGRVGGIDASYFALASRGMFLPATMQ
jgi:hypothetical protein